MSTATWTPVSHTAWTIADPFWTPRRETLFTTTLASQHRQLADSGRLSRLGIAPADPARTGSHCFYDSDIAKWLEAVAYAQAERPDAALRAAAEAIIAGYERIQMEDGYLNSHFAATPADRWGNLHDGHELYCLGHLIEAATAWSRHAGCDRLLRCCQRAVDHIWRRFGPDGLPAYCGHPEIELALMRLWRLTGDERCRRLCRLFVDRRGRAPSWFAHERANGVLHSHQDAEVVQDARPLMDEDRPRGHAVRCLYLLCGALDLAQDEDDTLLAAAIERIWRCLVERHMHATGAVGSDRHHERFTADFDLDPFRCYGETCASIAAAMLAQRLLANGPRGDAGDVIERTLHNSVLAGWSLDGNHYHYANPLAVDAGWDGKDKHWTGLPWRREPWLTCACCPPNVARTVAALGSYAASTSKADLALHLPLGGTLDAAGWGLDIAGDWVREGRVEVRVRSSPAGGSLHLRLPAWSRTTRLQRDGQDVEGLPADGYVQVRDLAAGSRLELAANAAPQRMQAPCAAGALAGRVALRAGPLIYCLETCDHPQGIDAMRLPADARLDRDPPDHGMAGCRPLTTAAKAIDHAAPDGAPRERTVRLRAIPYALWNHRAPGSMRVWIRT